MSSLISLYGSGSLNVRNAWSHWVDHIMKKHYKLVLTGATLLRHNGEVAASSRGFSISEEEFEVSCMLNIYDECCHLSIYLLKKIYIYTS